MVELNAELAINDIAVPATVDVPGPLFATYEPAIGGGLSPEIKQAILDCFAHVAWVDPEGADYYNALYDLCFPPAELVRISAVYTQSGTVYPTTSLDSLKSDLVVKAHYSDGSAVTLSSSDYTLSGTLSVGTSTVAVSYEGKNTSFTVTVTAAPTLSSITAVYTQSGTVYDTDALDSLKADLVVTAIYTDSSEDTVPSTDYTLSGTLTEGTSTVTVSYGGVTTTFTVTVTAAPTTVLGYIGDDLLMMLDGYANGSGGSHASPVSSLVDQSGNGKDWTLSAGTVPATNMAFEFDGSDAFVSTFGALTTPKTVEIVMSSQRMTQTECILVGVALDQGADDTSVGTVSIKGGNVLHCTGSTMGCLPCTSGRHTYTFVNDNGTWKGYKDGVLTNFGSTTVSWKTGHNTFGAFRDKHGGAIQYGFAGSVYNYRVYSSALSAEDVAANYANDVDRFGS